MRYDRSAINERQTAPFVQRDSGKCVECESLKVLTESQLLKAMDEVGKKLLLARHNVVQLVDAGLSLRMINLPEKRLGAG
jgi:hypothetical protein